MKSLFTGMFVIAMAGFAGCGSPDLAQGGEEDPGADVTAAAACSAYLLDSANFSGPLQPFPVNGAVGSCINLPLASDNRTSSFRLAGCAARFFDGPNCTGASYLAATSGVMPAFFDNRTTSLRFQ